MGVDRCAKCGEETPAELLDAILLDEEATEASAEAYCQRCFPLVQRVASDRWRPLGEPTESSGLAL